MIKFLLVAVSLTATTLSVKADGNELFKHCTSENYVDWGYCTGFVSGVVSTAINDICLPKGVQRGQAKDIVVKFLQENPELRHYNEADIVTVAVGRVFPCTKKVSS